MREHWIAHGICMEVSCGYAGDMEWLRDRNDGLRYAFCPKCDSEWSETEMAETTQQRKERYGF